IAIRIPASLCWLRAERNGKICVSNEKFRRHALRLQKAPRWLQLGHDLSRPDAVSSDFVKNPSNNCYAGFQPLEARAQISNRRFLSVSGAACNLCRDREP